MQLGISLHETKEGSLEERIQMVKEQDFCCVQLSLEKNIHTLSVRNGALTPGYAMNLKRTFQEAGVDIAVLACYMNLGNPQKEMFEEILKRYKSQIRFASVLGAGVVGTETGAPNVFYRYEKACHTKEARELLIRNLAKVVEYAEQLGVSVAMEPCYRHIVYDAKTAREVLDAIQSPNLQILFDPVNLLDASNFHHQKRIVGEAIDLLGDEIAVVHLKDYKVTAKGLIYVPAGLGEMEYDDTLAFLKKEKPYIHAILENTTPDTAVSSQMMLKNQYDTMILEAV